MDHVRQITIVGTGLLGASCGLGLRAAGYNGRLVGLSRRPQTAQRAKELGCIDEAGTELAPHARLSQLVIIAIPLRRYEPVLQELAKADHDQLVITDVGSTKQHVCDQARQLLPAPARFVGSHPMAGSEQHGPDAARADLFNAKPCVTTPQPDTDPNALATVESLWTTLKMRLVQMSPQDHDRQVARISHLPHALASLLFELAAKHNSLPLASTGFRDTTRVASGDPTVWLDIFTTNRQAVIESLDAIDQHTAQFRRMLTDQDDDALLELLTRAKQDRDNWIKTLGPQKNS